MVRKRFTFTEAPDFAAALGLNYDPVNKSFERREELERENDERRERNAELPLELAKEIIDFSPKAAKMVEGINEARRDRMRELRYDGFTQEDINETEKAINEISIVSGLENEIKNEALENKDNETYEALDISGEFQTRKRLLILDGIAERSTSDFKVYIQRYHPEGFDNLEDAKTAYYTWRSGLLKNLDDAGFNERFVRSQLGETLDTILTNHIAANTENITALNVDKEQARMIEEVRVALNSEDPFKAFEEISWYNRHFFEGNEPKANRALLRIALSGVEAGLIPYTQLEEVLFGEVSTRDGRRVELIKLIGEGNEENLLWAEDILNKLDEIKLGIAEDITNRKRVYGITFIDTLDKLEVERGTRLSQTELYEYISENWDGSLGGTDIPEALKNRLTGEGWDDLNQKAYIDELLSKGIMPTKEDVEKLNNIELEKYYLGIIAEGGDPSVASQYYRDSADSLLKQYARKQGEVPAYAVEGTEGVVYENIMHNARRDYPGLYEYFYQTAANPEQAHFLALQELERRINAGNYDTLIIDEDATLLRGTQLETAETLLKNSDDINDIINNQIIPGSDNIIQEALLLSGNTVHDFYVQLGDKLNINPSQLQYVQLQAYNNLKGDGEEIPKSELLIAYEALPENVQFLLNNHPSPEKVARAKIEAFKDDGVISYDEVEFLIEEANTNIDAILQEEGGPERIQEVLGEDGLNELMLSGNEGFQLYARIVGIPQLGQLEPQEGDWKELPGLFRMGYAVFKDGEWVYSPMRNSGSEYIGPIESYKDGFYSFPFDSSHGNPFSLINERFNTSEVYNAGDYFDLRTLENFDPENTAWGTGTQMYIVWDGTKWVQTKVKGDGNEITEQPEDFTLEDNK